MQVPLGGVLKMEFSNWGLIYMNPPHIVYKSVLLYHIFLEDINLVQLINCMQFLIWVVVPNLKEATVTNIKNLVQFGLVFQYIPRLFLIFPLTRNIVMTTGVMTETAWAGAAYNLVLYMLASHVCSTDIQISCSL